MMNTIHTVSRLPSVESSAFTLDQSRKIKKTESNYVSRREQVKGKQPIPALGKVIIPIRIREKLQKILLEQYNFELPEKVKKAGHMNVFLTSKQNQEKLKEGRIKYLVNKKGGLDEDREKIIKLLSDKNFDMQAELKDTVVLKDEEIEILEQKQKSEEQKWMLQQKKKYVSDSCLIKYKDTDIVNKKKTKKSKKNIQKNNVNPIEDEYNLKTHIDTLFENNQINKSHYIGILKTINNASLDGKLNLKNVAKIMQKLGDKKGNLIKVFNKMKNINDVVLILNTVEVDDVVKILKEVDDVDTLITVANEANIFDMVGLVNSIDITILISMLNNIKTEDLILLSKEIKISDTIMLLKNVGVSRIIKILREVDITITKNILKNVEMQTLVELLRDISDKKLIDLFNSNVATEDIVARLNNVVDVHTVKLLLRRVLIDRIVKLLEEVDIYALVEVFNNIDEKIIVGLLEQNIEKFIEKINKHIQTGKLGNFIEFIKRKSTLPKTTFFYWKRIK